MKNVILGMLIFVSTESISQQIKQFTCPNGQLLLFPIENNQLKFVSTWSADQPYIVVQSRSHNIYPKMTGKPSSYQNKFFGLISEFNSLDVDIISFDSCTIKGNEL